MMGEAIRIAVIGMGKIARDQHLPAIAGDTRFDLMATADGRGGIDGVPNFADLAALLAEGPAIDAVAICTPPQVRGPIAAQAIAAGKHVLLEKPPAATIGALGELTDRADRAGVTLFAAWHSRHAPMVVTAKAWLAGRAVARGSITWREDLRRWHPGQAWLWAAGGLGVFDPGINALSILTEILDATPTVAKARVEIPENASTPIAAQMTLMAGDAAIAVDFDFRQEGPQTWDIAIETMDGQRMLLSEGGSVLSIDGAVPQAADRIEYPGLYDRFATLIAAAASDADGRPLALVADALLVAEHHRVAAFHDDSGDDRPGHHQVA